MLKEIFTLQDEAEADDGVLPEEEKEVAPEEEEKEEEPAEETEEM